MSDNSEERRRVLEMLGAGTITVDEAERLLLALGAKDQPAVQLPTVVGSKPTPKYLRVVVREAGQDGESTPKVNIRVPLQLVRSGVKLGAVLPPEAMNKADAALKDQGLQLDLRNLNPESLDEFIEGLSDLAVEVQDKGETVRVFCE